ncbi:desulfoferrodoxin, partial [PVC group bacterium]|nr:desulfoferrodoxin [PVC group bacterium]
ASTEKHVPVIERDGNRVTVKVGQAAHPMAEDHYILFVEIVDGKNIYRRDFHEGDQKAEAVFLVEGTNLKARTYCNLHGFWETTV